MLEYIEYTHITDNYNNLSYTKVSHRIVLSKKLIYLYFQIPT